MSIKPATNEQVASIKANFAGFANYVMTDAHSGSQIECDEVLSLIERIEYEVAYKDEYEAAQRDALSAKDAEIARLKAEVERLSTTCHSCGASGDKPCIDALGYERNRPHPSRGTGRAR